MASVFVGIGLLLPTCALCVGSFFLIFNPMIIYGVMKYGWVIAIFVCISAIILFFAIRNIINLDYFILSIISIAILTVSVGGMIFGMVSPQKTIITVNSVEDFKSLDNVQDINKYRITIKSDLDFGGELISLGDYFNSEIKFNYHTISNFAVENGLFDEFEGKISNVTFDNVKIYYYEYYDEYFENRSPEQILISKEGMGELSNVKVTNHNFEYMKSSYDSGCGCSNIAMYIFPILFIGGGLFYGFAKIMGWTNE
ncbi:MAG: hypothetical protein IJY57_03710 [Clostridia bacterium]|nr:hypothetical protein [Clostridia bacterium]